MRAHPFLADPNAVSVAGDWHADSYWAHLCVEKAARGGATHLLHTGDFAYQFTDRFLDALDAQLAEHGLVLGFADGNHDNHDWLNAQPVGSDGLRVLRERIVHLPRGFRWTWDQVQFLAVGGAHSVDRPWRRPGVEWWPDERLTPAQAQAIIDAGHADVVIAHDAPAGVQVAGLAAPGTYPRGEIAMADAHRDLLRTVADAVRPSAWWHGHYHARYDGLLQAPGYATFVHGLGREGDRTGNLVTLPSAAELAA